MKNQQMKQPLDKTQAPQKPTEQDILQEKDQVKDKPDIKSKPRPKQIIVAGDSIVKGLRGWMMSRDNRVKIHSFSGANSDEMQHFLKPLLDREPSHVILHCGTNDLAQGSPCREVAQRIVDLSKIVANKGITCSISLLTKRTDSLNPLVQQVNNLIENGFESETIIDFIGSSLKFIESYLKDRSQCCNVNGQLSSMKSMVCGVPQGSIIGPLLFIIYMNDLPQYVSDIDITMFADYTSFARAFTSLGEIRTELIPAFSKICRWLSFNKLSLNTVKTEFMIIGKPKSIKKLDVYPGSTPYMIVAADGSRIRRVKLVKSLGLIVDDTLTSSNHIEYISTKMKRDIGVIKKTSKYLDKHSLLMLYRSLVETHLRYSNIIWGQCNETLKDRLQMFQNKAARTVAEVKYQNADHLRLICQLGWLTFRNLIRLDLGIFMYNSQNNLLPEKGG